ncbi:MAG: hypothetical protein ACU83U_10760, partial [Gammaproteobacteria bacterium]
LQAGSDLDFIGREIGTIKVAGRSSRVKVFELQGQVGTTAFPDLTAYQEARDLCRIGCWAEAEALFSTVPDDPVCQVYALQCRKAQALGGWDGVWMMDNK